MAYKRKGRRGRRIGRRSRPEVKKALHNSGLLQFNGLVSGSGDILQLQPVIQQSNSEFGRNGASINLLSCRIRGTITISDDYMAPNVASNRIGVRLMVLKPKSYAQGDAMPPAYLERLLEFTIGGYTGTMLDFTCPINREMFTPVIDKHFYMYKAVAAATHINDIKGATKFFNFKLPGKVLKYDQTVSGNYPTNFPYIMCLGFTSLNGAGVNPTTFTPIAMEYNSIWRYTDY